MRLIICYYRIEFISILAGAWFLGLFALFSSPDFVNLWGLFNSLGFVNLWGFAFGLGLWSFMYNGRLSWADFSIQFITSNVLK